MVMLGWLTFTALRGCAGEHHPSAGIPDAFETGGVAANKGCWIFHHMNKSGGQTVKGLLEPWIKRNNVSGALYDSPQWKNGTAFARDFLEKEYTMTWGAYAEGLRPHGVGSHCKWFTVFRHPVRRLVSAYYFCHKRSVDPLCATEVLRVDEADLLTFAQHWSNFGLRQFASAFILPESVMRSRAAQECPDCPGWFLLKMYLDEAYARNAPDGEHIPADAAMFPVLQPAKELLQSKYAAVGILENFSGTLRLFEAALEIPDMDWTSTFEERGLLNKDTQFHAELTQAAAKVIEDEKIKKYLELDLLLYKHALAVHRQQLDYYGLV